MMFSNFLIITIECVNTPKYLFLPDCSFKICEKPSKCGGSLEMWWLIGDVVAHLEMWWLIGDVVANFGDVVAHR